MEEVTVEKKSLQVCFEVYKVQNLYFDVCFEVNKVQNLIFATIQKISFEWFFQLF